MMQVMIQLVAGFGGGGGGGKPGESGPGDEGSDAQGIQGPSGQSGMEQTPGPLGQALESKRTGKVGGNPGGQP